MALPSEPLPLFSPTHLASSNEQVLHSIFSPTLQGGVTSFNNRKNYDGANRERQKRERIAQAAKRVAPKTPAANIKMLSIQSQPSQPASSPDRFFSPVGRNTTPTIPGAVSKLVLKTPANLARSAFRSPRQGHSPDFVSPLSTISALTNASTCSFKSLPIDMLSFDYVSNCNSPKALQQIVDTLSADGSQHYPSLMRKAKSRLASINEQTVERQYDLPAMTVSSRAVEKGDHSLYISSTKDESSLALSLSSSMLDNIDTVPFHSTVPIPVSANVDNLDDLIASKVKEPMTHRADEQRSASVNDQINFDTTTNGSSCVDVKREEKLLAEIKQLTEEIRALRSAESKDNVDLKRQLESLEEAKNEAERKVSLLEKAVVSSSSHARGVTATLESVREESQILKDCLQEERTSARSTINEAKATEEGLRCKIQSIAAQLAQCQKQNADVAKAMESRFRRQVEQECANRDEDLRSLQLSLQNAQTTLRAMKEERNTTIRSIHQALGKSTDGVSCRVSLLVSNSD